VSPAHFAGHRVSTISTKTGGDLGINITDGLSAKTKFQHNANVAFIIINILTTTTNLNMFVVFPVILNATFISCGTDTFGIDTPTITFNAPLPVRKLFTTICNLNANITYRLNTVFDGPSYTV
jgi:hypothetical protein